MKHRGTLLVLLMLCHGILPERPHYRLRVGICSGTPWQRRWPMFR